MGMWFEAKAYPSEEGLSVYYRDVTQRKRAEETLRETQARFERAFADAPVGVVIVGPELRFLSANRAFCRMVGRSEEEMRALTFEDVTHKDDLPASHEAVARLMAGEERAEIEKRYRAADGQVVRARTTLSMVRRDPIEIVAHVQRLGAEVPLRLEDERSQAASRGTSR
jgi:PAS domain S-box-containing protein